MKKPNYKLLRFSFFFACLAALFSATLSARAQTITNTFSDGSLDLATNGVLGSGFDGVYLAFGDASSDPDNGGDGNGATLQANSLSPFTGFLVVQTEDASWAAAGNDGFFAYNLVWGDFDAQLEILGPYDPANYNFSGLLARAVADGSGAPFGGSENWVNITRFDEFGIATQMRYASNAVDTQITLDNLFGSTADTNIDVYIRLTRTGDTFTSYDSATYGGPWTLEHTVSRPDLHGAAMQVGIEQATFGGNTPTVFFANFGVSGTNVVTPPTADPSGVTPSAPLSPTSLTVSWTPASGSDGSVVVLRPNGPILDSPLYGFKYVGNPTNGAVTNLSGRGEQVVYSGSGSSVTLQGLGGSNNVYTVAVYSYTTNGGTTPITYDANPALGSFNGPGTLSSVSFTVAPTSIPVEGYGKATVKATYTSGDSYDVTSTSIVTVTNTTFLNVSAAGDITGLAAGSEYVTATFAGVSGSQLVSIHAPSFTDDFSIPHNYLVTGLAGTGWESLFQSEGDQPQENDGGDGVETTLTNDASITAPGALTVAAKDTTWVGTGNNGFLLAKYVQGDFQAAVHIHGLQRVAAGGGVGYQFAGLMARAYNASGLPGESGGPSTLDTPNAENWVFYAQFSEFGISTIARYAQDGVDTQFGNADGDIADNYWLLMVRSEGTNFTFYRKINASDPWQLDTVNGPIVHPELTNGVPLQVGLAQAMYSSAVGWVQFDSLMIDTATNLDSGGPPPSACSNLLMTVNPDFSLTLNWQQASNNGAPATSFVVMRDGAPVSQQPPYGFLSTADSQFGAGTDLGGGNFVVARGVQTSVTVTGLKPGDTYYAAVYGYINSSTTKIFNTETEAFGSIQNGTPTNMITTLPNPSIPINGLGSAIVNLVFSGNAINPANFGAFTTITSSDTNVAVGDGGLITGIGPGTATLQVVFSTGTASFTNFVTVTVRAPAFTDNFTNAHNYLANGVTGTPWSGLYDYPSNTIPNTDFVSDPAASILTADAGITTNGTLTVSTENVGWEYAQNDGFFLYKYVPADFQMAVHLVNFNVYSNELVTAGVSAYDNPGLLARLYSSPGGVPGSGFDVLTGATGTTNEEDWISWTRFDQFGIGTYARAEIANAKILSSTQPDVGSGETWLLLVRQNETNFFFYQKAHKTDAWKPAPNGVTYTSALYANQPMQVGIIAEAFDSGAVQTDQFDNFMLDISAPPVTLSLTAVTSGGNIVITWPDTAGAVLQSASSLTSPSWQTVTATPTVANGVDTVTLPIGSGNSFFRLQAPANP
jgi:hypothetical protein